MQKQKITRAKAFGILISYMLGLAVLLTLGNKIGTAGLAIMESEPTDLILLGIFNWSIFGVLMVWIVRGEHEFYQAVNGISVLILALSPFWLHGMSMVSIIATGIGAMLVFRIKK